MRAEDAAIAGSHASSVSARIPSLTSCNDTELTLRVSFRPQPEPTQLAHHNKALINRGSITFWLDDEAIQAQYESATPSSRGRPQRYSDLTITTVLVIKRVFRLTLRAAQGFIDSIFL